MERQIHELLGKQAQRKTRSRPRSTTSPPPVFEISSRNRFAPLCETERHAVIIGDSIIRHVRATLTEGKVHTHCFPGARVLDVSHGSRFFIIRHIHNHTEYNQW